MNKRQRSVQFFSLVKAARRGDLLAIHGLGAVYATDKRRGIKSPTRAVRWYARGAKRGDGYCQYDLGFMLLLGEGAPQNTAKGLWWLERSFENGVATCARLLGEIYSDGHFGVAPDSGLAAFWEEKWVDSGGETDLDAPVVVVKR